MSTTENFSVMLKEYMPNELLTNEVEKLSWFIKKVKRDSNWGYGPYQLPAETQEYSRFEWGQLPAATDIPGAKYAKPEVTSPKELFGSMIFDNKDLERHDGDMKKSFLQILPGKIRKFVERMEEQANIALLGDGSICALTANGTVGGIAKVGKKIGVFTNGMKVTLKAGASTVSGYVNNIDINAETFKLVTAAGGSTAVDISAYTTAAGAVVYLPGGNTERMTSLIDIVFPSTMGGSDTLYGGAITKADSPIFQPFVTDLSSATTGAQLLSALYDFYFDVEELGRSGLRKEVIVPYYAFKAIAKETEDNRRFAKADVETTYGSKSILLTGPNGDMKVTAARGMALGKIVCVDWDALVLASRGELIKKAKKLGDDFFEIRNQSGYQFIVDKKLEAELIATNLQALGGAKIATSII